MKYTLISTLLLWSSIAGAVAPQGIKGQADTSTKYPYVYQLPNKQVTDIGAGSGLLETGNTNELANSGFEASGITSSFAPGWQTGSSTGTVVFSAYDSSVLAIPLSGKRSLKATLTSGGLNIYQQSTINASQQLGVQKTCSAYVNSPDITTIQLCAISTGYSDICTTVGGYSAGSGKRKLTVSFLGGATNNGCKIITAGSTTGSVVIDEFTMGDGAPIVDFNNTTDWQSYSGSMSYGTTVATNLSSQTYKYSRVGDKLSVNAYYEFNGIANATGEIRIPLPPGLSIDVTKISTTAYPKLGTAVAYINSKQYSGFVRRDAAGLNYLVIMRWDDSGATDQYWQGNSTTAGSNAPGGIHFAIGQNLYVSIEDVPIVEWGGQSSSAYVASAANNSFANAAFAATTLTASTWTQLNIGTVAYDTATGISSNTYVVREKGYYSISGSVTANATSAYSTNHRFGLDASINSTGPTIFLGEWKASAAGSVQPSANGKTTQYLNVGDIVRFFAINDPSNVAIQVGAASGFQIERLPDLGVIVGSFQGVPTVPGATSSKYDSFSFSYGDGGTFCTGGGVANTSCSTLSQIGAAVTSVKWQSSGVYIINTPVTYSKLKCTGNYNCSGAICTTGGISCASTNACTFSTYTTTTVTLANTSGTILCQGEY